MFDVIAFGRWTREMVKCVWTPSTFSPAPEVQQQIDHAWAAALARPGIHLYDGPMCRMEALVLGEQSLELRLSPTTYKAFLGTNMTHPELPRRADPIGLSVALESADGMLMLGRRNERVAYYPSRIHPFAGTMEPDDSLDVFADILRELTEELALSEQEVSGITLAGIVTDRQLKQPELIFLASSTLSHTELHQRLDPAEHIDALAIAPDRLDVELSDVVQWTPVGVAAALVWGREKHGDPWLREKLGRLT